MIKIQRGLKKGKKKKNEKNIWYDHDKKNVIMKMDEMLFF